MLKIQVPATSANLGAGFDSLGLALNLYNDIWMAPHETLEIKSLDGAVIPCDRHNLIYQAASFIYRQAGKSLNGLSIQQINRIPMARGLGSSSACIAAGVMGANMLLHEPFSLRKLLNFAVQIEGHPDNVVPAILGGLTVNVCHENTVHFVKHSLPAQLLFYAIIPDIKMPTSDSRSRLPKNVPLSDAVFNLSRSALFVSSILEEKYENLPIATEDKLHQNARLQQIPLGKELCRACIEFGAYTAYLSGAGSTIIAIADKNQSSFFENINAFLHQHQLSNYKILKLHIDNEGTKVFHQ